jgi:uncharacterized membrane protein YhaH (DUF805 family)
MNPIGLALAFLVFWSLVAVGTFLIALCARRLRAGQGNAFWKLVNSAIMLFGVTLTSAGLYATYVVLYGR